MSDGQPSDLEKLTITVGGLDARLEAIERAQLPLLAELPKKLDRIADVLVRIEDRKKDR